MRPLRVIGGDWSFVALPGANLRGVTFQGVRMREIDLTGAHLDGAVITNVDLSGAMLHSAVLDHADLRGSDLAALDPTVTSINNAIIDTAQAIVIAQTLGFDIR